MNFMVFEIITVTSHISTYYPRNKREGKVKMMCMIIMCQLYIPNLGPLCSLKYNSLKLKHTTEQP